MDEALARPELNPAEFLKAEVARNGGHEDLSVLLLRELIGKARERRSPLLKDRPEVHGSDRRRGPPAFGTISIICPGVGKVSSLSACDQMHRVTIGWKAP